MKNAWIGLCLMIGTAAHYNTYAQTKEYTIAENVIQKIKSGGRFKSSESEASFRSYVAKYAPALMPELEKILQPAVPAQKSTYQQIKEYLQDRYDKGLQWVKNNPKATTLGTLLVLGAGGKALQDRLKSQQTTAPAQVQTNKVIKEVVIPLSYVHRLNNVAAFYSETPLEMLQSHFYHLLRNIILGESNIRYGFDKEAPQDPTQGEQYIQNYTYSGLYSLYMTIVEYLFPEPDNFNWRRYSGKIIEVQEYLSQNVQGRAYLQQFIELMTNLRTMLTDKINRYPDHRASLNLRYENVENLLQKLEDLRDSRH